MKPLELVATLDVAAASGLVHHDGALFVVADDGLDLLRVDLEGQRPLRLPLTDAAPGAWLPKKKKHDLEALLVVGDALLALGSGSKRQKRRTGFLSHLDGRPVEQVDLAPLYDELERTYDELNLEGAVLRGDDLFLAQRGNGQKRQNALVRLDRARFEADLAARQLTPASIREFIAVPLGELSGVPLSLTDLAVADDGTLLFTAAAENTDDPYLDGTVAGSVVGRFDAQHRPDVRATVDSVKLEGVCCVPNNELRLVADPDDPGARAPLFRLGWPR